MSRLVLRSDGGARGNPGPAGCGFVLELGGDVICGGGKFIGTATNNIAEYEALIWGLENARALGHTRLTAYADSELMVKQLTGAYRVKNAGLKPLFTRALQLIREFDEFEIEHIRREENVLADTFANQAMDAGRTVGDPACLPAVERTSGTLF